MGDAALQVGGWVGAERVDGSCRGYAALQMGYGQW
jgi:hypothetical protein